MIITLEEIIKNQKNWSEKTFGPGRRDAGIIDHIKKELREIEAAPGDIEEWVDVVILALDAAWRNGFTPEEIVYVLLAKQEKNKQRKWPDWRTAAPGKAIEHVRTHAETCLYTGKDDNSWCDCGTLSGVLPHAAKPEPMPTGNGQPVLPEVIKDLEARNEVGVKKYGTTLRTNNGRDTLMDAYQEALDLSMYLKQTLMDRDEIDHALALHDPGSSNGMADWDSPEIKHD